MTLACCLDEDFLALPKGDKTKVGEMGHILSGGQRSRISLARALYKRDSDIVLIDGTLSSLDALVARKVLENAIKGDLCRDKVVFLVTYDLDQASEMDFILYVSDDGSVSVID